MEEENALAIAEELLNIIPDSDSDVTDDVYEKIRDKAMELDSVKDRL